ncbi:hypothetical protein CMO89_01000 [Candidatus Woesearchaeota archaeon]|nr:hypothetical protein [Candidatus Woesearchaeota archaeon]|tara:strand:+ start:8902 stop:9258 length:357 start_codon:yes stop_codon:yes gene_type:complete
MEKRAVYKGKSVVGLVEDVTVFGKNKGKKLRARIDTGATKSSIDKDLVKELGIGPVIGKRWVKSAHGTTLRPVVKIKIKLSKRKMNYKFTIADRKHMRYKILIGQNILQKHFLIDPSK